MTVSAAFSSVFLQVAGQAGPSVPAESVPAQPAFGPYSLEFLLHAAFIWVALIVICLIVFGYRKMREGDSGNFPDVYHRDLHEMRKRDKRS